VGWVRGWVGLGLGLRGRLRGRFRSRVGVRIRARFKVRVSVKERAREREDPPSASEDKNKSRPGKIPPTHCFRGASAGIANTSQASNATTRITGTYCNKSPNSSVNHLRREQHNYKANYNTTKTRESKGKQQRNKMTIT
jgi:hypothetical protein